MNRFFIVVIALIIGNQTFSQDTTNILSLEESIQLALENNLTLQASMADADRSRINKRQAVANLFPDVNGSYNLGVSNGRSINPYTNAYIDQKLSFSNASLVLDAVVFNAFGLINNIRQEKLSLQAAELEVQEAEQNLVLNVTLAYLEVLSLKDLVALAENRLEVSLEQVERLRILYEEEVGNPADYSDILGQAALDRTSLVEAENALDDALGRLMLLLNTDEDFVVEDLDVLLQPEEYPFTPDEILSEALGELPGIEASRLRVEAAEKGIYTARASYYPSLSVFAELNTNYSSAAEIFVEDGIELVETGEFVTIGEDNYLVQANQPRFESAPISYRDQFENNLNSVVGLSLRIPVFNGLEARNRVALQKIALREREIALEEKILDLKQSILESYNEMNAAYQKYQLLLEQVDAYEESFRINEIRFNSGVSNMVAYTISKNNLDSARINLAQAKYEYLLRTKVLEYFRGEF